jgi:hypothetical protein
MELARVLRHVWGPIPEGRLNFSMFPIAFQAWIGWVDDVKDWMVWKEGRL